MPSTNTSRSASMSVTSRWAQLARLLAVGCVGVTLSACAAQPDGAAVAQAPRAGAARALTVEPTDVIRGQRPAEGLPATPKVRQALSQDQAETSHLEAKSRQAAASAALSRAGRIGSRSIGQSAAWSSAAR